MNPVSANLSGTLLELETRHINFSSDRREVPAMKLIERMSRRDPSFAAMIQRSLKSVGIDMGYSSVVRWREHVLRR